MSVDIQADVDSMEVLWREGGCVFMLVFCFAVGGEVLSLLLVGHIFVACLGDCVCVCVCACAWGRQGCQKQVAAGGSFLHVISSCGVGRWVGVCVGSLAVCVCGAGVPQYRA